MASSWIRGFLCLLVLISALPAHAVTFTLAQNADRDLSLGTTDPNPDGITDVRGLQCNCPTATSIRMLNSGGWSTASESWANANLTAARNAFYSTGDFIPSEGDVIYFKTGNTRFFKMRPTGSNTAAGIGLEVEYLGQGVLDPPVSSYTFSSYDLFTTFTDTSTGSPNQWSWVFNDGEPNSTQQHPRHRFPSAGSRSVCLTASNNGGAGNQSCQNVAVSERPSTTVAVGASFDFDTNAVGDLQVLSAAGACGSIVNKLRPLNGGEVSTLSADYRLIDAGDIAGANFSTSDFCVDVDYLAGFLVKTGSGAFYKAWTASNGAGGIRIESALLQAAPPPPPVSSFTFSSYDLITTFTDTSTESPTGWDWDFGDGVGSSAVQNPVYRFSTAGNRSVCLVAENVGGFGNQACQSVTVNTRPSTTVPAGGGLDMDSDGSVDLVTASAAGACGAIINLLGTQNGSHYLTLSEHYQTVTLADADGGVTADGTFCVDVDFLSPFLIKTAGGKIYKAWTAHNTVSSVRIEYALLNPDTVFANGFD